MIALIVDLVFEVQEQPAQTKTCAMLVASISVELVHFISILQFGQLGGSSCSNDLLSLSTMSLPFHRPKLTMVRERIIRPANAVYVTFSSLAEATIARSISYASVCKCIERLANSSCFSGRVARLLISAASDAFLRRPSRWIW